jgi:hypothetical protein
LQPVLEFKTGAIFFTKSFERKNSKRNPRKKQIRNETTILNKRKKKDKFQISKKENKFLPNVKLFDQALFSVQRQSCNATTKKYRKHKYLRCIYDK